MPFQLTKDFLGMLYFQIMGETHYVHTHTHHTHTICESSVLGLKGNNWWLCSNIFLFFFIQSIRITDP